MRSWKKEGGQDSTGQGAGHLLLASLQNVYLLLNVYCRMSCIGLFSTSRLGLLPLRADLVCGGCLASIAAANTLVYTALHDSAATHVDTAKPA